MKSGWLVGIAMSWQLVGGLAAARGDDWPQWLGPQRDGVWRETGILEKFPTNGPTVLWRAPLDGGYSGPAVAAGRVYVTDYVSTGDKTPDPGTRNELVGKERVHCLDAKTGQMIWRHEYDCPYKISYPAGPRCTPTVAGGKVYTLGAEGNLLALDAATGKVVWSRELKKDYQTTSPVWGFTGHPLVDGQKLICLVGGAGSVVVAFDKDTGAELWKSLSAKEAGYCAPSIIEAGGKRQLLMWHPQAINGLDPETGKVYWTAPLEPLYGMSIQSPRKLGDLLYAGGIGDQAVALKLASDKPAVSEVWRGEKTTGVYPTCSPPFLEDGVIFGACQQGHFRAVDLATGKRLWETFAPTTGKRFASSGSVFFVKNGDRFFMLGESGDLIIAKLSREKYDELARVHVIDPTGDAFGRRVVWSHPAFANRAMYARNDKEIICVSLASP